MFRDKVIAEAIAQRELRKEGRPIPASLKRYARAAGLLTTATTSGGAIAVFLAGYHYGVVYWGALLFLAALALAGLVQAIVGSHILTRR